MTSEDGKGKGSFGAFLMRLLTHNTLKCPAKDVVKGYPLRIHIVNMEVKESDFDAGFIAHILPSLDWDSLLVSANAVGMAGLPSQLEQKYLQDSTFLQAMHHLLLDIHIINGTLNCPESGRSFEIKDGIPNMNFSG